MRVLDPLGAVLKKTSYLAGFNQHRDMLKGV